MALGFPMNIHLYKLFLFSERGESQQHKMPISQNRRTINKRAMFQFNSFLTNMEICSFKQYEPKQNYFNK